LDAVSKPDGGFLRGRNGILPLECKPELVLGAASILRKQFQGELLGR